MLKIGITHGDTNGIGYEIIFKTFADPTILELCTPIIYGSPKVAAYHRKALELNVNYTTISDADSAREGQLNLVPCTADEVKVELGTGSEESGHAALAALERAVADWREGKIDALVTAPINKHVIQGDSFQFPGQTEYLQDRVGHDGQQALMILMNETLRVAVMTTHTPIAKVAAQITTEHVVQKLASFHKALRTDFGVSIPRIAVLALNPHAGDAGLIGNEEQTAILPAIEQAKSQGMHVYGPFPADSFFATHACNNYDGILAMYHDQGLIPFKMLAMEDGVNFTAGLDLIRTSPDHGVAYDIAGKNEADEASMRKALYTAIDLCRNRQAWNEGRKDPLPKLYVDRRENHGRPE